MTVKEQDVLARRWARLALIDPAPSRTLDPVQSVMAHLPNYGLEMYEGLCSSLWNDPAVPIEIKEGLRFLSATRIGCAYCRTVREVDHGGRRLLPEAFYSAVAGGSEEWDSLVDPQWAPLFGVAAQVLDDVQVSLESLDRARESVSDMQIVQAIFLMLLFGASHRFSRAFGLEATCEVPSVTRPG